MLVVISKVMANRNRVEKYTLMESQTKRIYFKTPSELSKLLSCSDEIVGACVQGDCSIRPSNFFRPIPDAETATTVKTVVQRILTDKGMEFVLSDPVGRLEKTSKEDVISRVKDGQQINGVKLRSDNELMTNSKIELILRKGETNHED